MVKTEKQFNKMRQSWAVAVNERDALIEYYKPTESELASIMKKHFKDR